MTDNNGPPIPQASGEAWMPDEVQSEGAPLYPGYREFEIQGDDGTVQTASNGCVSVTVFPDGASRMRKRNAIKNAGTPQAHRVQWLYAELDEVRCYVKQEGGAVSVVMTRQDLYP